MAFANITTLYVPTAANAGASQWGTDVRKLLDAADAGSDSSTKTNHGTSTSTQFRTVDPYTTTSANGDKADMGWAVTPSDMNSVSGARRFFPAGSHTLTIRMGHDASAGATGSVTLYAYRVASAASSRSRTLLGSGSASVALPALAGQVTATVAVTLPEIIFEADETIQYSLDFAVVGVIATGRIVTFYCGTQSGVVASLATPKLGVLADTTGSAAGSVAVSGASGKVLGAAGSATGLGVASGVLGATGGTTGSASGSGSAAGLGSSVAGATGAAAGSGSAAGLASIVLGTTGAVQIGSSTGDWPVSSPTKSIAGAVLHHETGAAVAGATVRLVRDSDGLLCQSGTSGADGSYSFDRDTSDPYTYHVSADYDDSGTPVQGLTPRGLVPA